MKKYENFVIGKGELNNVIYNNLFRKFTNEKDL